MAEYYVRHSGGDAVGPVAEALLVRGIGAGKVPSDAEVCPVGGREWLPLISFERFQDALPEDAAPTRVVDSPWFEAAKGLPSHGPGVVPPPPPPPPLRRPAPRLYDEDEEAATRVVNPLVEPPPSRPAPAPAPLVSVPFNLVERAPGPAAPLTQRPTLAPSAPPALPPQPPTVVASNRLLIAMIAILSVALLVVGYLIATR